MSVELTLREHQLVAEAYAAGRADALTEAAAGMADRWGMHPRYRDDVVQWLRRFAEGKTLAQMLAASRARADVPGRPDLAEVIQARLAQAADPPGGDPAARSPQHAYDLGWIDDEALHGPWDKDHQRYEDGCKAGDRHDDQDED